MKRLSFVIAALAFAGFIAQAQQYQPVVLQSLVKINGGATGTYTLPVNVRGANTVGVQTTSCLAGSGSEEIIYKFKKSADGATFETTPSILVTNTSNGTTPVVQFTAVDVTGVHTIQLASVVNGSSGYVVTNSVTVGVKNFLR
jgi:hypothetical protein